MKEVIETGTEIDGNLANEWLYVTWMGCYDEIKYSI